MPSLNWIGREAVERHHTTVPFHLLKADPQRSIGDADSGNLLIEGDNLLALKALLPYYAGQVKCIYIDPPYNTGNEGWTYNDNVNSPQMREWLGKIVGGQSEDLSRHDKWLCMMYPRLVLLRQMLRDDGSLWMSIDDNELHHARLLLDEIFGEYNFIASVVWEKSYAPKSSAKHFSERHEYILLYAKSKNSWQRNLLPRTDKQDRAYKNPDNDSRGLWRPNNLAARNYYSRGTYSIKTPSGRIISGPPKGSYWRVSEERFWEMDKEGRIWWGEDGNNVPAPKIYLAEVKQGVVPETIWFYKEVGHSQEGKKEIIKLLPEVGEVFTTPKPVRLIQQILQTATNPGDLILDTFAGSGTTGHAVLKMGEDRRFILVEMEPTIAAPITAERLKRVIEGYGDTEGLGGGFQYCTLGPTLFDAEGRIRPEVSFDELAQFVYFKATGTALPKRKNGKTPLLGIHNDTAVYLLYNGILKDKSTNGGNALTRQVLASLPPHTGSKIIYGTRCLLGDERLRREAITFKHIPTDLQVE